MDGEGSPSHGGAFRDACSGPSPVFGRFSVGVGRTPPRSVGVGGVVSAGEFSAHQSPGDESLIPGSSVLPGDGHVSPCDRDVRQLDGGCLHQQARRDGVRLPLLVDQATSPMERVLRCPVGGEVPAGQSNVLADLLSRREQVIGSEWSLHPRVARSLLRVWGSPSLDLFATHLNAKLPLYCSLVPDPQDVFEDAF